MKCRVLLDPYPHSECLHCIRFCLDLQNPRMTGLSMGDLAPISLTKSWMFWNENKRSVFTQGGNLPSSCPTSGSNIFVCNMCKTLGARGLLASKCFVMYFIVSTNCLSAMAFDNDSEESAFACFLLLLTFLLAFFMGGACLADFPMLHTWKTWKACSAAPILLEPKRSYRYVMCYVCMFA